MGYAGAQTREVLVVDDDPEIREVLAEMLRDEGFSVETARNGREALERVRSHRPMIVLLDLMMPVMNGWEFLEETSADESLACMPVIVVSAAPVACPTGARACLRKPFEVDELLEAVDAAC